MLIASITLRMVYVLAGITGDARQQQSVFFSNDLWIRFLSGSLNLCKHRKVFGSHVELCSDEICPEMLAILLNNLRSFCIEYANML